MTFLRNVWYVAALDTEVGREMLTRTILNEAVVMYRKEDGQPVAIQKVQPSRIVAIVNARSIGVSIGWTSLKPTEKIVSITM